LLQSGGVSGWHRSILRVDMLTGHIPLLFLDEEEERFVRERGGAVERSVWDRDRDEHEDEHGRYLFPLCLSHGAVRM
jgi:hypothetical protein